MSELAQRHGTHATTPKVYRESLCLIATDLARLELLVYRFLTLLESPSRQQGLCTWHDYPFDLLMVFAQTVGQVQVPSFSICISCADSVHTLEVWEF